MKENFKKTKNKYLNTKGIRLGRDKEYFFENLTTMLSAGMDISAVLTSLRDESPSRETKRALDYILYQIENGSSIWKAFDSIHMLPERYLSLIKIGEQSGKLVRNLKIIISQRAKDAQLRSRIRSALLYPAFMIIMLIVVGSGLAIFVLPKLSKVYNNLKIELPFVTLMLINMGKFLEVYGAIVVPAILVAFFGLLYILFFFPPTKYIGQIIAFRSPIFGKILKQVELSRMGYILGTLLDAGFPIVFAAEALENASKFYPYKKVYNHIKVNIELGASFQKCFSSYKNMNLYIPISTQYLIVSAEQSGDLPGVFRRIGKNFERKNLIAIRDLTTLLEPVILVIVALGVSFIALAVVLPVYSIVGNSFAFKPAQPDVPVIVPVVTETPTLTPTETLTPIPTPTMIPDNTKVKISGTKSGTVDARLTPDLNTKVYKTLKSGTSYTIVGQQEGWYQLSISSSQKLWVQSNMVTL